MGFITRSLVLILVCSGTIGTANFEGSFFLDPEARVGVFVGANVMCALDAFSSPHGNEPFEGQTVHAVALTVLNMATSRPVPDQGRGILKLYLLFDLSYRRS
jgi:hypothetical protein